jgi:dienelactone hydrolase
MPGCCKFFFLFPTLLLLLMGCQPNYFLLHPLEPVPEIYRESEFFDRGQLRIHWLARYPDRPGKLPAVLVHPDRGSISKDMEGICLALARRGYFAAAVDYQRVEYPEERNPLLPWRSREDALASLEHLNNHPRVNPDQIALLGYSKGAILSLQIASEAPSLKAVIAYYALADFDEWRQEIKRHWPTRIFFWFLEKVYTLRAGDRKGMEKKYWGTSPIKLVDRIQAPVLLIHGEKDATFPLSQAQLLCQALLSAGKSCELFVVPGAGHVFNFINAKQGELAWEKTVAFLDGYLRNKP